MYKKLYACFILIFWYTAIFPQTYFFDNYSAESGIGNSKVYSIIQDKNHLIWMGTPSGVSTFDGLGFKNYTSEQGLAENGVWTVFQDRRGYIWFGHYDGGISRWNGKNFEFIPANIIFNKDVHSFCETEKGELWVTSEGSGAALISNPGAPLKDLLYEKFKGKRLGDRVYSCIRMHDKLNYFITDGGLKVYDPKAKTFNNFYIKGMPLFFQITAFYEDSKQNLWIGTFHGGLYRFSPHLNKFTVYDVRDGLSSNFITNIMEDNTGKMWICTEGGITKIVNDKLQIYNQKNGLPEDFIYCAIQDAENNILIGTKGSGLSIYKGEISVFTQTPEVIPNSQVWSILEDSKKRIWIGTNGGISIYDPGNSKNKKIRMFGEILGRPYQIRFLKEDNQGTIWIGTDNDGVYQYNPKSDKFTENIAIYSQLPNTKKITSMDLDKQGNLWIGTLDPLIKYNIKSGEIIAYDQADGLQGNDISAIYVDSNNTKYIGSRGKGLTIFSDSLSTKSARYPLVGNTTPNCITSDTSGNIWIGTNQGVLVFNKGNIKKRYQEKDGLLSDLINFIKVDDNNDVYIGTNRGLNKIAFTSGLISSITKRNGFVGIEAHNNAILKDSRNSWWFGTVLGAIHFDNNKNTIKTPEPFTKLIHFTVNQKERAFIENLKLNYKENAISFQYNSICITNPDAVAYQVMLVGADKEWQQVTTQTSVSYFALPPGGYIFKVKAKNSEGKWNKNPVTYNFVISPPFYITWWFIGICILIVVLTIFLYVKNIERKLIKEKQILEETVKERTIEVVNINDELAAKNKDIVDSITYASRIQNALLPPSLPFDNTMVLFLPKDIVSGDFFWFTTSGAKEWFAAVDCTGHGVPGAFMSIIGHSLLDKIVKELGIVKPSEILDKLSAEVSWTLHQYQSDNEIHDGMDISLACFDKETHILSFAGAFNPLWIVRQQTLIETKANRAPIGFAPELQQAFDNHEINIESGDLIYLFSDGYADQFGGPYNKKLKIGAFKELILKIGNFPIEEQSNQLNLFYNKWRGMNSQVDDILVIGRKFIF